MEKKTTYKKYITVTIVLGFAYWLVGEGLLSFMKNNVYSPLKIAAYFTLFFIAEAIALTVLSFYKRDWSNTNNRKNKTGSIKTVAIVLCIFSIITFLFEFLYELGKQAIPEPTSIIFLMDDSSSMASTEGERISAVEDVMSNRFADYPYAIYTFSDDATMIRPMGKKDSGSVADLSLASSGGTDIITSVHTVLDDFENGKLSGAGNYPKILLISDGQSYSIGFKKLVKRCISDKITISCIGIEGCNHNYMQKIANNTGGVFVYCSDTSLLAPSMAESMNNSTSRDLLSERIMFNHNGLYAFLRIAFLSIMGVLWSFMKFLLSDDDNSTAYRTFICSTLLCTGSSVFLEIGFAYSLLPASMLRLIFCICWAFTLGITYLFGKTRTGTVYVSGGASGDKVIKTDQHNLFDMNDKPESKYIISGKTAGAEKTDPSQGDSTSKDNPFDADNPFDVDNPFDNTPDTDDNSAFESNPFDDSQSPF